MIKISPDTFCFEKNWFLHFSLLGAITKSYIFKLIINLWDFDLHFLIVWMSIKYFWAEILILIILKISSNATKEIEIEGLHKVKKDYMESLHTCLLVWALEVFPWDVASRGAGWKRFGSKRWGDIMFFSFLWKKPSFWIYHTILLTFLLLSHVTFAHA